MRQRTRLGTSTTLDVLYQNQQLLTILPQLVAAQHDAALAEFNLTATIDPLITAENKLPVELYDVESHYKEIKWLSNRGGLSK